MKKVLALILILHFQFSIFHLNAENYPYRSDFLWVTNPNHADWLYKTGEDATVEVQLYKYGVAADAKVTYEIAPDMLQATKKGSVTLKNGKATINVGTRKTPGFLDLRLSAVVGGEQTRHHVKVGFDADKIQPYTQMPADFKTFWNNTVAEARKTPLSYTRELAKEYCTDKIDCWLIKLQIDASHYMYGYLTMPKNLKRVNHMDAPSLQGEGDREVRLPAVFCPPGAGIKTIKEPLRHKYYAEDGFIRLECEIHGIDPRLSEDKFKEISSAFCNKSNGYFYDRFDNREAYYMRHVYVGMARWMDFLCSLPEWDGKNLAVQGGSQGGALSIVAAALTEMCPPTLNSKLSTLNLLCCVNHPALTDMAGYAAVKDPADINAQTGGYPHFSKADLTPQVQQCLQYYDVINFCRQLQCPVRMTWGYNDSTCPPTTSYAAWNTLTCTKERVLTPINEHWTSEQMEREHEKWILKQLRD